MRSIITLFRIRDRCEYCGKFYDDCQSTHERTLDTVDLHWCSLCLHGLRFGMSGILAGGIPGFGIATFLLSTWGSSREVDGLSLCFIMDDLLRTRHTSCLVITFQVVFDASFHGLVVVWFCLFWLWLVLLVVWFFVLRFGLWNEIIRLDTTNI